MSKAPNSANRNALRVTGVLLLLLALTGYAFSQRFSPAPLDVSALMAEDFKDGMGLSFREAALLDHYATVGMGEASAYYCALSFDIAGGEKAVASLEVLPDGPFYDIMAAIERGESGRRGDVTLSFCATASALSVNAAEFLEDYVKRVYGPFTNVHVLPFSLIWCGDDEAAYAARMAGERGFYLKLAIPCAALGVLAFVVGGLGRRGRGKREERENAS